MQFEDLGEAVLSWMEALRAWLLQQSWLDFARRWITEVDGSTMWAILVVLVAGVILLIGFWPAGKAEERADRPPPKPADAEAAPVTTANDVATP